MQFKIIATGSSGNAYVLNDDAGNCIIIEAGIERTKINSNLPTNFEQQNSICLISHNHQDHSQYAASYQAYFKVFKAWEYAGGVLVDNDIWKVVSMKIEHNVECYAFVILNKIENKKILFATDFFAIDESKLSSLYLTKLDFCAIECNYNNFLLHKETDSARRNSSYQHCSDDYFLTIVEKIRQKETVFCSIHGSAHFLSHAMLNAKFMKKFSNYFEVGKKGTNIKF